MFHEKCLVLAVHIRCCTVKKNSRTLTFEVQVTAAGKSASLLNLKVIARKYVSSELLNFQTTACNQSCGSIGTMECHWNLVNVRLTFPCSVHWILWFLRDQNKILSDCAKQTCRARKHGVHSTNKNCGDCRI